MMVIEYMNTIVMGCAVSELMGKGVEEDKYRI